MKYASCAALSFLAVTVLFSSIAPGLSIALQPNTFSAAASQGVQVWFDSPQFVSSPPCAYQMEVHAQTSSGLWITNLHWDFGDGATLDVPYSAESAVSDVRTHIYATAGTYSVSVIAYDSDGNTGSASQTLTNVTPGSCDLPALGPSTPTVCASAMIAQADSLTLPSGCTMYLYGFVTGGGAASGYFNNGAYQEAFNVNGHIAAALANTTSNTNSFSTLSSYYSIGGVGVSGYSSMTRYYGINTSSGATTASVSFSVSTSNSLVVVLALGGDEQCIPSVSGLAAFITDASNQGTGVNAITIGHAVLGQGPYTVEETTSQCATGQNPSNAADLIGVFVFQPMTSSNVCTQGATIPITPEPLIPGASGEVTLPSPMSEFSVKYFVCGPTSVKTGQWGEYTILLQLWNGNQLSMSATSITSGTILLSLDRRQGPDVAAARYEGYYYYPPPELGTSGWQQINLASAMRQQEVEQTALFGILGLIPGVGTVAGFIETMAGLLGITGPAPPQPPSEFTTPNTYYVSEFPIAVSSVGVMQYRVVFDLNPYEAGSTEVYLWSWVEIVGPYNSSAVSFEIDFAIQGQA